MVEPRLSRLWPKSSRKFFFCCSIFPPLGFNWKQSRKKIDLRKDEIADDNHVVKEYYENYISKYICKLFLFLVFNLSSDHKYATRENNHMTFFFHSIIFQAFNCFPLKGFYSIIIIIIFQNQMPF